MTPEQALHAAGRYNRVSTATLILSTVHVATCLRAVAREVESQELESHLEALSAQLHAGLVARPELEFVEQYAAGLKGGAR